MLKALEKTERALHDDLQRARTSSGSRAAADPSSCTVQAPAARDSEPRAARIAAFQLAHGLKPDGIVGRLRLVQAWHGVLALACTWMVLNIANGAWKLESLPRTAVGVIGGDTSSRAVQALAPWALGWVGRLGGSSPVVRAHADDPAVDGLELMLKGGQMGEDDVLDRLVDGDAQAGGEARR